MARENRAPKAAAVRLVGKGHVQPVADLFGGEIARVHFQFPLWIAHSHLVNARFQGGGIGAGRHSQHAPCLPGRQNSGRQRRQHQRAYDLRRVFFDHIALSHGSALLSSGRNVYFSSATIRLMVPLISKPSLHLT